LGVVVALENHGGVTSTAGQVERFLHAIDSPWFGINLDFGNFRNDPYAEFARIAPRTVTTHAKLTSRFGEETRPVDYARVKRIMDEAGYCGYLSIEYEEAEDPRTAVPRFVDELKRRIRSS
jgi:sugar phosphate isomerase/epimerase